MNYDIEADWTMFTTCNYACSYCFFPESLLRQKLAIAASPEEWSSAFDQTGLTWLIHLTGGEPTILPRFADLCELLSRKHYLSLNSNLSRDSIKAFSEQVDPSRVHFINAGFHPLEREQRSGFRVFFENVDLLRSRGFRVMISLVGDPKILSSMDKVNSLLEPRGLAVVPKVLRGPYDGKVYPRDYTDSDRENFRSVAQAARKFYAPMLGEMAERPSIDPFHDDQHLEAIPEYIGRKCKSGSRFVMIDPRGEIRRCPNITMGNLLRGTFEPLDRQVLCNSHNCFYFCNKYADLSESGDIVRNRKTILAQIGFIDNHVQHLQKQIAIAKVAREEYLKRL